MAFAEFIAENFYSMADLNWDIPGGKVLAHFATEDGVRVEVQFQERTPGRWVVSFDTHTPAEARENYYLAFFIFNGVFQATEDFIAVREPEAIIFTTKREELAHIYETYLAREQSRIEALGYRLLESQRIEPFIESTLQRTNASRWRPIV